MKKKYFTTIFLLFSFYYGLAQSPIFNPSMTITPFGSVNSPVNETFGNIIDGNVATKFLDFNSNDGMGFTVNLGGTPHVASSLMVTTANDMPGRDPKNFEVFGSNDGSNFTSIGSGVIDCNSSRFYPRLFCFTNTTAYSYYRINFTNTCSENWFQLSEVQLYTSGPGVGGSVNSDQVISGIASTTPNGESNLNTGSYAQITPDIYYEECIGDYYYDCYWDGEQDICDYYYNPCMYMDYNYIPGHTAAQSFKTTSNVVLKAIKIDVAEVINQGNFYIRILQGDGIYGQELRGQNVSINNPGTNTFILDNTLALASGQSYTFIIQSNDVNATFNWTNSNDSDYINGSGYVDGNNNFSDFNFELIYQDNVNWQSVSLSGFVGKIIKWQKSTNSNFLNAIDIQSTSTTLEPILVGDIFQTTYFRAVIEGCSIVYSNYVTISVNNNNLSKVIDSQCGATLPALNTLIRANAITGATKYRFKIVNGSTTEIIEATSGRGFRLTSLPDGTFYNTTYTVSVSVKRNNIWGEYGDECAVTTPAFPATKVQNSQCGTTLASINTYISPNRVWNNTGYRYKVVNGASTQTIEAAGWFRLTSLPGGAFYNTTYTISVASRYNGVWSEYGEECTVTTPVAPATKVRDSQCGITLASINTTILANAVSNTTGYRFKVVNGTSTETIDAASGSRWFRLTSLSGGALYNTTYTVSVATRYNGVWSEYGEECLITTPAAPLTKLQDRQCGITLSSGNTTLLYANPVSVAQKYRFEVSLGADTYLYDTNSNNERSFRMTEVSGLTLVDGTTYAVKVAIMANDVWQPFGESCTITTFGDAPNFVKIMNIDTTAFNVVSYPNPFTENFNLNLTSLSEEKVTVMVYDMTGKLLERKEVVPSELSELQVGTNFASGVYNVIVSQGKNTKSLRVIKK